MALNSQLKCIYCDASGVKLSDEHIIPHSLGGTWVIPKASCPECAKITSKFERSISRRTYLSLRTKAGYPTYHPKSRPASFEIVIVKADGTRHKTEVPSAKYPTIYPALQLPPPGILSGAKLSEKNPEMSISIYGDPSELKALTANYPDATRFEYSNSLSWRDLSLTLAKIAHSFMVGYFGTPAGYTPLLPQLILGKYPYLSHLVGGVTNLAHSNTLSLWVNSDDYGDHLGVDIDIMGGRLPRYRVVAGVVTNFETLLINASHALRKDTKGDVVD